MVCLNHLKISSDVQFWYSGSPYVCPLPLGLNICYSFLSCWLTVCSSACLMEQPWCYFYDDSEPFFMLHSARTLEHHTPVLHRAQEETETGPLEGGGRWPILACSEKPNEKRRSWQKPWGTFSAFEAILCASTLFNQHSLCSPVCWEQQAFGFVLQIWTQFILTVTEHEYPSSCNWFSLIVTELQHHSSSFAGEKNIMGRKENGSQELIGETLLLCCMCYHHLLITVAYSNTYPSTIATITTILTSPWAPQS